MRVAAPTPSPLLLAGTLHQDQGFGRKVLVAAMRQYLFYLYFDMTLVKL